MKKVLFVIFIGVLCVSILSVCTVGNSNPLTPENDTGPVNVNIGVLRGPTAIGIVQLMDEADNGRITSNNYSFDIAGSVDGIIPGIIQGTLDIAAVPPNIS